MNEYKIMIVDDEPDILELLENHIRLHSCKLSLSIWDSECPACPPIRHPIEKHRSAGIEGCR